MAYKGINETDKGFMKVFPYLFSQGYECFNL